MRLVALWFLFYALAGHPEFLLFALVCYLLAD